MNAADSSMSVARRERRNRFSPGARCCLITWLVLCCCISVQASTRTVKGVVLDQTGATVSGAQVSIHAGKYRSVQRTDTRGSFSFEVPPGEPAVITVQASGFAAQQRTLSSPEIG